MKPFIITTIPVKNGERFILAALRSLARQTHRPDRVIVLDNAKVNLPERYAAGGLPHTG